MSTTTVDPIFQVPSKGKRVAVVEKEEEREVVAVRPKTMEI
jgi:hypothetical protein